MCVQGAIRDDALNNLVCCKLATTQIRSFSLYDSGVPDRGEHRQAAGANSTKAVSNYAFEPASPNADPVEAGIAYSVDNCCRALSQFPCTAQRS
jgi:hypothetical protein